MRTVFIQANNKQLLGAKLAKYAIERKLADKNSVTIEILNVDTLDLFKKFAGQSYLRDGKRITYDPKDLQSFTLSRFLPPQLMGYAGKAVVIDPDIFALMDINVLFDMDMQGKAILACRKKAAWDTSVMLLDCARLTHWNVSSMLSSLASGNEDYARIMTLADESSVAELSRTWNSLDHLDETTHMLHTTNRLTQPWKTGLPIDFTRKFQTDLFLGIIPKRWLKHLVGRWPTHYQPHPDKEIERFFFELLEDALAHSAITEQEVYQEVLAKNVREDLLLRVQESR